MAKDSSCTTLINDLMATLTDLNVFISLWWILFSAKYVKRKHDKAKKFDKNPGIILSK